MTKLFTFIVTLALETIGIFVLDMLLPESLELALWAVAGIVVIVTCYLFYGEIE